MKTSKELSPTFNIVNSKSLASCLSLTPIHDIDLDFQSITPPQLSNPSTLTLANTPELVEEALKNKSAGLIIPEKIFAVVKDRLKPNMAVWTTQNLHISMSEVFKLFDTKKPLNSNIHPTACIDPSAEIGHNCTIEPYVVIGKNVHIGNNCILGSHSTIENNASIGNNTKLSSHTYLGYDCHIGDHCIIGPHSVFGSDGFGFVSLKDGTHQKIPQIGNVVVEDHCELGAHCAIDRAAITTTYLRKGSKLDNFVHIAHNCDIGENALIAAGFFVAGSTTTGKNMTAAGGVHVNGHIKIADHVVLTGRAGVINSIEKSGVYGGFPSIEHKENLKIMTSLLALPKLRKQINRIIKHLGLTED
ncbi:MAG: UDP-3-O-(3-hydroxymyristoyl)glucosamine N-acyltransferase [Pseudobdellovibrio sp.]